MLESWNLLEIIWTMVAAVGASYSFLNIRNGIADLHALPKQVDEAPHIVATGNIRRDTLRMIIQISYVSLGLFAGLSPEPYRTPQQIMGLVLFSSFLIATSLLLTISARYDHRDRNLLLNKIWFQIKEDSKIE